MDQVAKQKIEHNHALASALQMVGSFDERPKCFGPVPSIPERIALMAASYRVPFDELRAEFERVTGLTASKLSDAERDVAARLLADRPPVLPGTRAILDRERAMVWHRDVKNAVKNLNVPPNRRSEFFDRAGVAD